MKNKKSILLLLLVLAACSEIPRDKFSNGISPETLLDRSKERVNLNISSKDSLETLSNWINKKSPKVAEVSCNDSSKLCVKAKKILKNFGVQVVNSNSSDADITLVYEKISAMDCDPSFMDRPINPYNLTSPHFGCSVSANMVRMVSDRDQFYNPAISSNSSGDKAAGNYNYYQGLKPKDPDTSNLIGSGGN